MYWSTDIFSVIAVLTNSEATKRCLLLELRHDYSTRLQLLQVSSCLCCAVSAMDDFHKNMSRS